LTLGAADVEWCLLKEMEEANGDARANTGTEYDDESQRREHLDASEEICCCCLRATPKGRRASCWSSPCRDLFQVNVMSKERKQLW